MKPLRWAFLALAVVVVFNLFLAKANAQTFSQVGCIITGTQLSVGDCIANTIPLAAIGILLSMLLGAITFMAGEVFNYSPLKGFYKRELWETVKSMIIIAIIFSSVIIAGALATALAGNSAQFQGGGYSQSSTALTNNFASLYTTANTAYIQPQLQSSYVTFSSMLGLSMGTDLLKTFSVSTWLPIPLPTPLGVVGFVQFGSKANIFQSNYIDSLANKGSISLLSITATYVTTILLVFQFQSDLLFVIVIIGFGVFIPVGIIMRAIPFVRGIGGTMIAIGIGISIVYPALLVGFNLPVTNYMYSIKPAPASSAACPFAGGPAGLLCQFWSGITGLINSAASTIFLGVGTSASTTSPIQIAFGTNLPAATLTASDTQMAQGFWTGLAGPFANGIFPALNFVIDNSLNQIVQFILFVFDIIIGVALTNGIASLMGGKLTLGIGKRFKLA